MGFNTESTRTKFGEPKKAVKNGIARSNLGIAMLMASQAKAFAPVAEEHGGLLRNSISASNLKGSHMLNDGTGPQGKPLKVDGLKGDEAYVGGNVEYLVHQEYGTKFIPAQPSLRPAKR